MSAGKILVLLMAGAALGIGAGAAFWFAPDSAPVPSPQAASGQPRAAITAAPAPIVGAQAPDFSLPDLQGRPFTLAGASGKAVLINFWATWCDPCREELPLLDGIAKKYPDSLRVFAVETGEPEEDVRAFADSLSLTALTILLDPSLAVRDRYLVRGLPTSFFINASGIVVQIKIGALDSSEIASILSGMGVTS